MRKILSVFALLCMSVASFAHGNQVAYCVLSNGFIRVYIEHWHGDYGSVSAIAGNSINVTMTYGSTTVNQDVDPSGIADNTTVNNLPGSNGNIVVLTTCAGGANTYNDWGYWDFAPAACGVPVAITINSGNSVVFEEACSNLFPATVNATFTDNSAPIITCPVVNVMSCNPMAVNFAATVTDACDPNPTVTYSIAPGSVFAFGTTAVTVTATDNTNQTSTCTFNVNLLAPDADGDGYGPTGASCGSQNDCDDNDPNVYPGAPELCDGKDNNCDGVIPASETDDDGDGFSECQGDCNDANAAINPSAGEIVGNNIDDNCDGLVDVLPYCNATVGNPCAYMFLANVTLATINNTSGCTGSGYSDYSAMSTMLTPGNTYTISLTGGGGYNQYGSVFVDWNRDGSFDDAGELVNSYLYLPVGIPIATSFTVPANATGAYRIRVVTDYEGTYDPNSSCYSNYGEIEDYTITTSPPCTPPTISCHGLPPLSADAGMCSAVVNFHAHATGTGTVITYSVPPGTTFPIGTTMVTAIATNACGADTCTLPITIVDNENPTITCPNAVTVSCVGEVPAPNANAVAASDNCGNTTVTWEGDVISNQTCANSYTIVRTYKATDANNNSATCTQTITVNDQTAPVISSIPANATVSCAGEVPAADNNAVSASDNCGGAVTVTNSDVVTPGSCANRYTIARTYTATDACGNASSQTQTITVNDQTAPVINSIPANTTVSCAGDVPAADNNAVSATDNCGGTVTVTNSDVTTPGSCAGRYTIARTYTATDACGNASSQTQTITVNDQTAPVITCPANTTVACDANNTPTGTGTATATDNCGGTPVVTYSDVKTNGNCVGNYTIARTWTATDACGNTSNCTQTITVRDTQGPNAICKNATVTLVNGTATITPAMINNGSTDACSGIASMSVSQTTFSCENIGNNTVTFTVTDACGNASTCNANVTVLGATPTCDITVTPANNIYTGGTATNIYLGYGPQSATINSNATGGSGFTYVWSGNSTANLSCTNCANPVFTPTVAGTYTYTVVVTNSNGCSTECEVTFCVKDIRVAGKNNNGKVYLCHMPPGNPANANTLSISTNAVAAHLSGHPGDHLGTCGQACGTSARGVADEGVTALTEEIKVYPNPNTGSFVIEIPHGEGTTLIRITDVKGQVIATKTVTHDDGSKIKFDISGIATGMYFVEVMNAEHRSVTKLMIQ